MRRPEEEDDDGMPTKSEIRVREGAEREQRLPLSEPDRKSEDEKPVEKDHGQDSDKR